ncbi:MAG: M28 family peptidase, partial [Planctomycetes bacterium]|nr:M28 family peptidase [Planctomycetota bacterium]
AHARGREAVLAKGLRRRARDRIRDAFAELGLTPAAPDGSYLQPVPACSGHNVIGRHGPGGRRAVLIAAHYDHLGPAGGGEAYWGADDNAAAVAILLEVARAVQGQALERDVWFVSFDGEEPPYFLGVGMGSIHFVAHPPFDLKTLDMMVCMDLMGHALGPAGLPRALRDSCFVLGAGRSEGTAALLDAVADADPGVHPRRLSCEVVPALSDYYAFDQAGIPTLFLTCGRWEHYHQVTDTPEKLDYPKVAATARWLTALTRALCARPGATRYVPGGTDDAGTVASLTAVAELLAPVDPRAAFLGQALATFQGRSEFDAAAKQQLAGLVSAVEDALSR